MKAVCVWFTLRQIRFNFCLRIAHLAPLLSLPAFIPYVVGMLCSLWIQCRGICLVRQDEDCGIWLVRDKRRGENLNSSFLVQTARREDGFNRELIIEEVFADSGRQVWLWQ